MTAVSRACTFGAVQRFVGFMRSSGPNSLDGIVAVATAVACELELALSNNIQGPRLVNYIAGALITLPIAFRRRWPLQVAVVMVAALVIQEALNGDVTENTITPLITFPMAFYTIAAHLDRRRAIIGIGIGLAGICLDVAISHKPGLDDFVFALLVVAGPWLVGRIVNARYQLAAELEEKADRLEREQERQARLAVAEERARIAREMHDVVAHNVSVMVVQASAARRILDRDVDLAREAITSVEHTGREALAEIRRMFDVLGDKDEDPALFPQPSMEQLDALLDRARAAGLEVDLEIEGDRRRVQSSVDLSAFRIVQEALNNTLKHSGGARARVKLRYGEREMEVDVTDDGRRVGLPVRNGADTGQGLVGMRERVAMLGGELEAGFRPEGGFEVHAKLPIQPED
jgi:signal transduction histidine kinase